jgi:hypothetical protein
MEAFTQSTTQTEILNLSQDKFRWETEENIDSVADLFDDDLVFGHLNGHVSFKEEWIKELRSRRFIFSLQYSLYARPYYRIRLFDLNYPGVGNDR